MPTNEKSEKHICHSSSSPCGGCQTIKDHCTCQPPPDKLAEAKKLIEELPSIVEKLYPQKDMAGMVFLLTEAVRAQDLISYERGREEQRKIDAEIAKEICSDSDCCGPEIYQKIINPSPDAK